MARGTSANSSQATDVGEAQAIVASLEYQIKVAAESRRTARRSQGRALGETVDQLRAWLVVAPCSATNRDLRSAVPATRSNQLHS